MEILESARKHGVADGDIRHALANPIRLHYLDGYQMVIGPSDSMQLLEVAVNDRGEIFHAMAARPKFLRAK